MSSVDIFDRCMGLRSVMYLDVQVLSKKKHEYTCYYM